MKWFKSVKRKKTVVPTNPLNKKSIWIVIKNNWQLYVLVLPVVVYYFLFDYLPMYGVQIAFRDYRFVDGITGSKWVGFKYFERFMSTYYFGRLITNTLVLNLFSLLITTPIPIILAVLLNQVRSQRRKRLIQTTIYIPHFISSVVLAGMMYLFFAPTNGVVNKMMNMVGIKSIDFFLEASWFRPLFIGSGIWQNSGYSSILFIATLTSLDPGMYEAAEIDGASIWQKIRHIDIPSIMPTFVMTMILNCGTLLNSATNKTLLFQTSGNISKSDIIGTYVYKTGLGGGQFSYTAAIGLFTSMINVIMVLSANKIAKKVSNVGVF